MNRLQPGLLVILAYALVVVASGCGPKTLEGLDCEVIGDEACEITALYVCDGQRFQKVADCHRQCVVRPATEHPEEALAGDQTWTCAESPHLVTRVLTLAGGASLTIEPGTEVRFAPGARIDTTPESRVVAEGTQGAPILFTSDDETKGGWASLNQGGLNLFVRPEGEEPSVLRHALVERAVNGVGLLGLEDGKSIPIIEDSQLRDNLTWGVVVRGCVGDPAIPDLEGSGNLFINNGEGAISGCQ